MLHYVKLICNSLHLKLFCQHYIYQLDIHFVIDLHVYLLHEYFPLLDGRVILNDSFEATPEGVILSFLACYPNYD